MVIDLTCFYDDGSRPPPRGALADKRAPLAFRSGEDVTVRVKLLDAGGGPVVLPATSYLQLVARGPGPEARELVRVKAAPMIGNFYAFTINGYDTQAIPAQTGTWDMECLSTSAPTRVVVVPTSEFALDSTYYPPIQHCEDDCGR